MKAAVLILLSCLATLARAQGTLQVAGYGGRTQDMFQLHIFKPFTAASKIPVTWDTVPGGIVAGVQAQQETENTQWDGAIALLGSEAALLAQMNYLAPLPAELVERGSGRSPVANAVLYGYGASIIVCNRKFVARCPANAAEFFDIQHFPGERMLSSFQPTTALAVAMLASGKPASQVFPIDMAQARRRLAVLKPAIRTFYSSGDEAVRLLRMGEVPIAYFWNGVIEQMLSTDNFQTTWNDGVRFGMYNALFKGAPNPTAGVALLRWIQQNPAAVTAEQASEGILPARVTGARAHADLVSEDDAWYLAHRTEVDDFWSEFVYY